MNERQHVGARISLPFIRVPHAEWAGVPRTVPDQLLRWGASLPYLALMLWCVVSWSGVRPGGSWRLAVPNEDAGTMVFYFPLLLLAVSAPAAGRLAPWFTFAGSTALVIIGSGNPRIDLVACLVAGAMLVLGLSGSLSGLRLTLAVRRWRLAASSHLDIDPVQLRATRAYHRQIKWIRRAAGLVLITVIYQLLKLIFKFFTVSGADFARISEAVDPHALEITYIPFFGILFWSMIAGASMLKAKIAGDVVLEVPLDPRIGPLDIARSALVIERAEASNAGCECGSDKQRVAENDTALIPVSESCPVHGIVAVNELAPRGFQGVAKNPWVWGANATELPVPQDTYLQILGLYGWGSLPSVPGVPVSAKDPEAPTHDGYRPWRSREPWRRNTRKIFWRDESDGALPTAKQSETETQRIDTVRLDAQRLPGAAIRYVDQRPWFAADPSQGGR